MGLILAVILGAITATATYFLGFPLWVVIPLSVLWLAGLVICFLGGHHGFGGGGNTDLTMFVAGLIIAGIIFVPKYVDQTPCRRARTLLEKTAQAQAAYCEQNKVYARDPGLLKVKQDPDLSLTIVIATPTFFVAQTSHPRCTDKKGAIRVYTWDSLAGGLQPASP